jgi:hypothetical protein
MASSSAPAELPSVCRACAHPAATDGPDLGSRFLRMLELEGAVCALVDLAATRCSRIDSVRVIRALPQCRYGR